MHFLIRRKIYIIICRFIIRLCQIKVIILYLRLNDCRSFFFRKCIIEKIIIEPASKRTVCPCNCLCFVIVILHGKNFIRNQKRIISTDIQYAPCNWYILFLYLRIIAAKDNTIPCRLGLTYHRIFRFTAVSRLYHTTWHSKCRKHRQCDQTADHFLHSS